MPKASVVIPAYNAMTYLPETMESVLNQTFTDFELLIINDGSSDHILEWTARVTDPRVKLISQENQGLSGARNTGIAHAKGEYVAFLDADDLWQPTKLERQVRRFEENPEVGLVYTWTTLIDEMGKPIGITFASTLEGNIWERMIVADVVGNGSCAMVRRNCFDKVGLFDRCLSSVEDWDMWLRISAHYSFAVVKEHLTLYRQHTTSMSKNRQRMLQNLRTVIEKAYQSVPLELLYLRARAYAHMYQREAWGAFYEGDYQQADYFRQQAILHNPRLQYSKNFINLTFAIMLNRQFGSATYDQLQLIKRGFQRRSAPNMI